MLSIDFKILRFVAGLLLIISLAGCATLPSDPSDPTDRSKMRYMIELEGFKLKHISAPPFILTAYHKQKDYSNTLVVYIEGDGYAWVTRTKPSDDPTPKNPLAFFLACEDPSLNILYLARPGQFLKTSAPSIDKKYWTSKRYNEEVVRAMNDAIDQVKAASEADRISLVGYSGGGAVAVLIASLRDDVIALRTIAGNLSLEAFTKAHNLTPLKNSIDPLLAAQTIKNIPQRHFIGGQDKVIPRKAVETFLEQEGDIYLKGLTEVVEADHLEGWTEHWSKLLTMPLYKGRSY